jgi:D-alanyl-D-alanine dipeptidase
MNMNRAIPNLSELRAGKPGYDTRYTIDTEHPLHNDPLVDPREFGFTDARSYYSKPNRMTGELLPGVPDAPLVRLDIARRIVEAEKFLRTDPEVREVLGAPARLRIADGLRPNDVQHFAYDVAWPMIIRKANPGITDEEVAALVPTYCAKPKANPTPTPHLTGGAVDVVLINVETDRAFDRGHTAGKVKGTAYPDFHEGYHQRSGQSDIVDAPEQAAVAPAGGEVVMARRVLYYAMTDVAGLYANPSEIWHYGKGDPLSAYVAGNNEAYYGIAALPDWYTEQMEAMRTQNQ